MGWNLTLSPKIIVLAQQKGVGRRMKNIFAAGGAGHNVLRAIQESDQSLGTSKILLLMLLG